METSVLSLLKTIRTLAAAAPSCEQKPLIITPPDVAAIMSAKANSQPII